MANSWDAHGEWEVPPGRADWLLGTGADERERALVWTATAAASVALVAAAVHQDVAWSWWQWLVVVVLAVDVAGGVPANAWATAKRSHSPAPPGLPGAARSLRDPVVFSALHLRPFLAASLLPDADLRWAAVWYLAALSGTAVVAAARLYLRRPLSAAG